MDGILGGSTKKVKMERFDIVAGIGKRELKEDGMDAQIFSMKFMIKPILILKVHLDFSSDNDNNSSECKLVLGGFILNLAWWQLVY